MSAAGRPRGERLASLLPASAAPLAAGLASFVPGLLPLLRGRDATRGSESARYCYSVWLRHLSQLAANGLPTSFDTVAELGPGDSLGSCLAAILCGARRALAFDVVAYAPSARNQQVLNELAGLFRARADLPGDDELPAVHPKLRAYAFPRAILERKRLDDALDPERIDSIREALRGRENAHGIEIRYCVPWQAEIEEASVDLVFSQACLEHVDDLPGAYAAMATALRPGGAFSHQIDFKSHRLTRAWDGHRAFSERAWRLVRGRRPYLINREPLSTHVALLERHFELRALTLVRREPETDARALAPRFRALDERDRTTSGAFVQGLARHPAPAGAVRSTGDTR